MNHSDWMRLAYEQALIAEEHDEVPIGAILVSNNQLLSTGFNQTITACDPTAHAEVICIRNACNKVNNHRLTDTTLYVTLEPCIMCYGAIVQARVAHVVFSANDNKSGVFTKPNLSKNLCLNHHPSYTDGIMAGKSQQLLEKFFSSRR